MSSGVKGEGSVVVTLHLGPVGDPVLFLWLLRQEAQVELVAIGPADLHSLVFWHYPVVDGPPEETKLGWRGRQGRSVREGYASLTAGFMMRA